MLSFPLSSSQILSWMGQHEKGSCEKTMLTFSIGSFHGVEMLLELQNARFHMAVIRAFDVVNVHHQGKEPQVSNILERENQSQNLKL